MLFVVSSTCLAYSAKIYLDKWRVSIKAIVTCVITEPRIRRAARSFIGQGRFWKIRVQKVINSSKRLNYMQTLQCASLQNEYFYQIKIIFTDIYKPGNTMSGKTKSAEDSTFSIQKWKMSYFFSYTVYSAFTFYRPSNSDNNESKNILFLNALTKDRDARRTSCHQRWWIIVWHVVTCFKPINPVNGLLIVHSSSCKGHEMHRSRGKCLMRRICTWNLCR